ncbi:hypothetical protein K523DRAFT_133566 [Schizophyllum commune Tattone D]|nr:hypothetical protein K523DRAFT_133566 [Schizophyllum commune Tattone D]
MQRPRRARCLQRRHRRRLRPRCRTRCLDDPRAVKGPRPHRQALRPIVDACEFRSRLFERLRVVRAMHLGVDCGCRCCLVVHSRPCLSQRVYPHRLRALLHPRCGLLLPRRQHQLPCRRSRSLLPRRRRQLPCRYLPQPYRIEEALRSIRDLKRNDGYEGFVSQASEMSRASLGKSVFAPS